MRHFQVTTFVVGVLCFLAAPFFIGQDTGDTLWRAGIAALMIDLACVALWPPTGRS